MNVECPTCRKAVEWTDANPERPFCSHRCKLIDLGAWANEEYRVPAQNVSSEDLDQLDQLEDDTQH
ncbi:DNA gyrase inhibitor YacG [Marinobacter sp. ELB17]|uniref:DNA gyrase inhibitor YacG n=1 Tax=Marinobacter sp. ELB17 TaxID=270374 RepID=UPI0000F38F58|nr:DNA gyrase inhibitor YacG [Marinobacter sp. ELB17]EBA01130.1 zinc-binding protein [Marinobacter sp. ELB17]